MVEIHSGLFVNKGRISHDQPLLLFNVMIHRKKVNLVLLPICSQGRWTTSKL